MIRANPGRVTAAAAAATLLAITLAVTIGLSGQVAAITTSQGWADSYTVDGKCYCSSSFDHGVGDFNYKGESVRQICRRLGSGPKAGRVYYNTIQCGHEPAHRDSIRINGKQVQDEVVCPGRVGNGVPCNSEKGAKWDLGGNNPTPTTRPPTTDPRQPGDCQATGNTRAAAERAYRNKCSAPLRDCDPVPTGGHLCSSKNIPNNPAPTPTTQPPPPTTQPPAPTTQPPAPTTRPPAPTPPNNNGPCQASGNSLGAAIKAYANKCSAPRRDCDPIPGGYLCSSENITGPAPQPAPTPTPTPTTAPAPTTAPPTTAPSTTRPPAPQPTPAPTPPVDPGGMVLDILDTTSNVRVGTLVGTDQRFGTGRLPAKVGFDLMTVPNGTRSVVFQVTGPRSHRQIENIAPYSVFGNSGSNFFGRALANGDYEVTVKVYAGRGGSGRLLASETLGFAVGG